MAKATSRKHATHKKARAHHAAKTHRRPSPSRSSSSGVVVEIKEAEIIDDESTLRPDTSRIPDEDLDDEAGIYSAGRGEDAGEATS